MKGKFYLFPKKKKPSQSKEGFFDTGHFPYVIDPLIRTINRVPPPPPAHTHVYVTYILTPIWPNLFRMTDSSVSGCPVSIMSYLVFTGEAMCGVFQFSIRAKLYVTASGSDNNISDNETWHDATWHKQYLHHIWTQYMCQKLCATKPVIPNLLHIWYTSIARVISVNLRLRFPATLMYVCALDTACNWEIYFKTPSHIFLNKNFNITLYRYRAPCLYIPTGMNALGPGLNHGLNLVWSNLVLFHMKNPT